MAGEPYGLLLVLTQPGEGAAATVGRGLLYSMLAYSQRLDHLVGCLLVIAGSASILTIEALLR